MDNEEKKLSSVAEKWCEVLKDKGYEMHISQKSECRKIKRFSRLWRRVLKIISLKGKNLSAFEVGCGGGKHLAQFALNGWRAVGIDCSKEVLERAKNYIKEISDVCGANLDIQLIHGDFLYFNSSEKFDLVFHVGVIEHFLDDNERLFFLKKMFELTKPGGYIISIVPNGIHPLRAKMKEMGLGGYCIAEIDYAPELLYKEMENCCGKEIKILPHNLFSYLLLEKENFIRKILYYGTQLIPISVLPLNFSFKHAGTLIAITKKEA